MSDRIPTFDEEITEEEKQGDLGISSPPKKVVPTEEDETVLNFEGYGIRFKDFTEPDILKTGYLIPITCGHNRTYSITEKTIYEIHLTNAGFLAQRMSDES